MAKMVFHNVDEGPVLETGPKRSQLSSGDVMKRHAEQMENMLREVERTGGCVPEELAAHIHHIKKEWG